MIKINDGYTHSTLEGTNLGREGKGRGGEGRGGEGRGGEGRERARGGK